MAGLVGQSVFADVVSKVCRAMKKGGGMSAYRHRSESKVKVLGLVTPSVRPIVVVG